MKTFFRTIRNLGLLALLSTLNPQRSTLHAQGTAFTYQGRLNAGASPATGIYDLRFALHDALTDGDQTGVTLTNAAVSVSNGLFTVTLDFGIGEFPGANRWLELGVRTNGGGDFTNLVPRQFIASTPYAIRAANAGTATLATSATSATSAGNFSGSLAGDVTGTQGATVVSSVGGVSAANVGIGANAANAATSANTANTIVKRDASGSFSAGGITATNFTGNGANVTNVNAATLNGLNATNFWKTGGNSGTTAGTHFVGTSDDEPLEFKVAGLRALRLEDNGDSSDSGTTPDGAPNLIGGSPRNFVAAGVVGATISGGGAINSGGTAYTNSISSDYGTIGGGRANQIALGTPYATIAGGDRNDIGTNSDYSTIGGGVINNIADNSERSTIGGGNGNDIGTNSSFSTIGGGTINYIADNSDRSTISGGNGNIIADNSSFSFIGGGNDSDIGTNSDYSVIGGGLDNNIADSSQYAMIPGGRDNAATNSAFAAGTRAKANHSGAFVWGDSSLADIASTNNNSVTMRASGGYRLFSNTGATLGVFLAASGNSWASISDRDAKKNFQPVDGKAVLEKLAQVPMQRWNYKSEADDSVPHLGPMAQDFKAAFYPGRDDKSISTLEFDGVELAAIQGLNQKLTEELKRRDAENAELRQRLEKLEQRMNQQNGGTK